MSGDPLIGRLLRSAEPSVRWRTRVEVLGEDPDAPALRRLREEIRRSTRVRALRAMARRRTGNPYDKWRGKHWIFAHLADLAYPPGDPELEPLAHEVLDFWLRPFFFHEFEAGSGRATYGKQGVPRVEGRFRRCASQQGNALRAALQLGFADERCDALAERLIHWQWPDGGWNCDRNPGADTSSFAETLLAMTSLALYAEVRADRTAAAAARRASEVFLRRHLFRRISNGRVMQPDFLKLHFPRYWHYDVLGGLRGIAAVDRLKDRRTLDARELLRSKQLPNGGWRTDGRYYRRTATASGPTVETVDWSSAGRPPINEWVTLEALSVLKPSG
ncbi:MAG TPA: hypothetical protein VGV89_09735 [Thermoplasmata archaeon]|nr:hypothetical protein [Thermoplasmata archaeon]